LTSLPQRFRLASSKNAESTRNGESGDLEVKEGANRVLVLAKEGLDMMAQVSGVLDGTIISAEEWCERLGRSKRDETHAQAQNSEMEKPPTELSPMNLGNGHGNGYLGGFPDVKMA
jgi:hypothetical protein